MSRLLSLIKKEVIKVFPAIIYFLIGFNLIFFTIGLLDYQGEVRYFSYPSVCFGALIAGKVLIIVDALPFFNAFPQKPLIYNITWKFFLYSVAIIVFWLIDASLHLILKFKSVALAMEHLELEFHL